jgi:hypothetical protein
LRWVAESLNDVFELLTHNVLRLNGRHQGTEALDNGVHVRSHPHSGGGGIPLPRFYHAKVPLNLGEQGR